MAVAAELAAVGGERDVGVGALALERDAERPERGAAGVSLHRQAVALLPRREGRVALEHRDADAALLERERQGGAADAGADDRDRRAAGGGRGELAVGGGDDAGAAARRARERLERGRRRGRRREARGGGGGGIEGGSRVVPGEPARALLRLREGDEDALARAPVAPAHAAAVPAEADVRGGVARVPPRRRHDRRRTADRDARRGAERARGDEARGRDARGGRERAQHRGRAPRVRRRHAPPPRARDDVSARTTTTGTDGEIDELFSTLRGPFQQAFSIEARSDRSEDPLPIRFTVRTVSQFSPVMNTRPGWRVVVCLSRNIINLIIRC